MGQSAAQFSLGVRYNYGEGVTQNYKTAAKWYTLAAKQGMVFAQMVLGSMYAEGQGVVQDNIYAHMW